MPKQPTTPRQKALDWVQSGKLLSIAINDAIWKEAPHDYKLLFAYAYRLRKCNDRSNVWLAKDLHNRSFECFDGTGRFWMCNLKLCPYCIAQSSRRSRRIIREALNANPSPPNPTPRFATLTIENPKLPILETRAIVNHAWSMFRKRKWFKENIQGGTKNEEFTVTRNGYHWHIHGLWQSRYIDYQDCRWNWTQCVRSAFEAKGLPFAANTKDEMLILKIKRIASMDNAINEVSKYVTKADSWRKVPPDTLLSVCRIARFPRMFDTFGTFKLSSLGGVPDEEEASIVHTKSITDGEANGWRRASMTHTTQDFVTEMQSIVSDTFAYRREALKHRFPYATFTHLQHQPNPDIEKQAIASVERFERITDRRLTAKAYPATLADVDSYTLP